MNLLELMKVLSTVPYWREPEKAIFLYKYTNVEYTVKEIIEILEKDGYLPGDQFENYVHNKQGIWGLSQDFHLTNEPIFIRKPRKVEQEICFEIGE